VRKVWGERGKTGGFIGKERREAHSWDTTFDAVKSILHGEIRHITRSIIVCWSAPPIIGSWKTLKMKSNGNDFLPAIPVYFLLFV
jgi:hypothetical protein